MVDPGSMLPKLLPSHQPRCPSDGVKDPVSQPPIKPFEDVNLKVIIGFLNPNSGGSIEGLVTICSSREWREMDHPAKEEALHDEDVAIFPVCARMVSFVMLV